VFVSLKYKFTPPDPAAVPVPATAAMVPSAVVVLFIVKPFPTIVNLFSSVS